ncbi:DUF1349 domain-containing protein [Motilibacter peucedani]|uniref:DUF1349 domain-containing protein n=1 Tax=Motilibacter peucedani TaxID=598650 RepID=UPI000EB475CE|nr:DUF1349 domain-containing protein [Motilibacter peucedani]
MTDAFQLPELPFATTASHPEVWSRDAGTQSLTGQALPHSDFYVNPGGDDAGDAASMGNAATLLGTPPEGDFQLSARVTVDFRSQYDAGVLMVWGHETEWAKLCFEFSPAGDPMVVSVVTQGVSDDANAFVVPGRTVGLRISRTGRVYAFHAATDGSTWQLVRVFRLGDGSPGHRVGFEVQSPTGEGCAVRFEQVSFRQERLADLRDGS